jgi:hypothetical protein
MAALAAPRPAFEELCAAYEKMDVTTVLRLFESVGVQRLCEEQITGKTAEALALLSGLKVSEKHGATLREAAEFLLRRDY